MDILPYLDGDVPRPLPMVYIFRSLFISSENLLNVSDFNIRNKFRQLIY